MGETILLTGGTGSLGTELAQKLCRMPDVKVFALIRGESAEEAYHKARWSWYHDKALYDSIGTKVVPVRGDFTVRGLGLDEEVAEVLRETVTIVIHAGAEVGFTASRHELAKTNRTGTANMLGLAGSIKTLKRFLYVSTAYVAGQRKGLIPEEDTNMGKRPALSNGTEPDVKAASTSNGTEQDVKAASTSNGTEPDVKATSTSNGIEPEVTATSIYNGKAKPNEKVFSTYYEKTKSDAEGLVRVSGLPFAIARPGMIVGDSETGWVRTFNTIYYVLKQMLLGNLPVLPISQDTSLNIIPLDYVAESVLKIAFDERAAGKTFHLTCPEEMRPKAGELARFVRIWARKNLSINIPKPLFIPMPALKKAGLDHNAKDADGRKSFFGNMMTLMPYFFSEQVFDRTNTDEICGEYDKDWQDFADKLLEFACRKNFMKQSPRTVFEQACVRREGSRFPVTYHNVRADGIDTVSGSDANRRISNVYSALYAWGIRKGDRVALTGNNTVEYMILEQALGLIGAVSVPIYYTTPAKEAEILLEKSGATWFFVGDDRMIAQIPEIRTSAHIVTFYSGKKTDADSAAEKNTDADSVMRWEDFISRGGGKAPRQFPAPTDLATIRYTSGTTGDPKGVMFSYSQLTWMGEVMTDLLTWYDRNDSMRYLSFLPLSHVVEGILALYAPYYVLCKVDYYFLNDFGALTAALPEVRPTVFFSVPRFYEKVWDQVTSNKIGQAWLDMKEGIGRNALGALLKTVVLRKAGIDKTRQLIVGSAPISETLLRSFRELGIEIHNAYGQTEAPLITINRRGDNVIPSIGTPLPDTEVTIEPDGELIVKGPQVALGYYGLMTDTICNGVLRTGDLGEIDETGHVTLKGRKKDFIITAYGENISIPKVEQKLKDIPGVSEAVLIGENRPYCTALIWLEEGLAEEDAGIPGKGTEAGTGLSASIDEMNRGLTHPEQIKKYKVIGRPLSIQNEELTPNLKVRRGIVEEHFADEIEEMYR